MPQPITDVDAFTDPVSVPEDGDDRNAASVETSFQALANRTRNLKNRLDGLHLNTTFLGQLFKWTGGQVFADPRLRGPSAELRYADADGVPTTRTRKVQLPLTDLVLLGLLGPITYSPPSAAGSGSPGGIIAGAAGGIVSGPLRVPRDCLLTAVDMTVVHPTPGTTHLRVYRVTPPFDSVDPPAIVQVGSTISTSIGGTTSPTAPNAISTPDVSTLLVEITLAADARLHSVTYTFADVGPRN